MTSPELQRKVWHQVLDLGVKRHQPAALHQAQQERQAHGFSLSSGEAAALVRTWLRQPDATSQSILAGVELLLSLTGDRAAALRERGEVIMVALLQTYRNNLVEWGRRNQLPIGGQALHSWIHFTNQHMNTLDLLAENNRLAAKPEADRFQAHLLALAILRGESTQALDQLAEAMPFASPQAISTQMAQLLINRKAAPRLQETCPASPSLEGLAWLHQRCPDLRDGGREVMMGEENLARLWDPFLHQVAAAAAELERQRMETRTPPGATTPKPLRL